MGGPTPKLQGPTWLATQIQTHTHTHTNTDGTTSGNRGRIGEQECNKRGKRRGKKVEGMANGEGKCSRSGQGSWRMRKCFWNMYPLLLHDVYTDKKQWFVVSLQFRWVCQALKQQCLQSLQIKSAGKQEMSLCKS